MADPNSINLQTFGFLTVVELSALGYCGGLLIVSSNGRPIEFHCTAPVSANRAQEIMYGKTYHGFLYSDQIGMALVDKAKHQPTLFITDCSDVLPMTELMDAPLVYAEPQSISSPFDGRGLAKIEIQDQQVYCANVRRDAIGPIEQSVAAFAERLPLDEPFERIRQALEEAHSVCRAA